jgi:hypothetical protein
LAGSAPQPSVWFRLSVGAAGLAMVGNVLALVGLDRVYGSTYPSLTDQAVAQDLTNLLLVSPLVIVLAVGAIRGSVRAYLGWLAGLTFTVYNYVIYTMSIHFGPLFPLWVAVLGLSFYALVGGLASVEPAVVRRQIVAQPRRLTGWFLAVVGILFALLWLSDIVRALVKDTAPASVLELGVPTNPVHVLDLAIFLPAAVVAGVLLLRQHDLGVLLGPVLVLFLALTGLPILVTPMVAQWLGDAAAWQVAAPIAAITAASLGLFVRLTRRPSPPAPSAPSAPPA